MRAFECKNCNFVNNAHLVWMAYIYVIVIFSSATDTDADGLTGSGIADEATGTPAGHVESTSDTLTRDTVSPNGSMVNSVEQFHTTSDGKNFRSLWYALTPLILQ